MRRAALAVVGLLMAGPAHAQDAAPAAPGGPEAATAALSAEEQALNRRADAFRPRLATMQAEMIEAARAARTDGRDAGPALDAVEARWKPEIDAMAADIRAFVAAHPERSPRWTEDSAGALDVAVSVIRFRALAQAGLR